MTSEEFATYWDIISIIEAQETLRQLVPATFSGLKKSDREKTHKNLYRQAYPSIFRDTRELKPEDLASILRG